MPEIFRTEINNGFISIWKPEENIDFFSNTVDSNQLENHVLNFERPKRLKEKLVPHYILSKYNPSILLTNTQRKPHVNIGNISVSHCSDFIAVAYTKSNEHNIGIDIEVYGDRILKIIHKFLNEAESGFCGKDSLKCLIIWSAKEAIFKKYGDSTAFFKENIFIEPFENESKQELVAEINFNGSIIKEHLSCELFADFVMVHTN